MPSFSELELHTLFRWRDCVYSVIQHGDDSKGIPHRALEIATLWPDGRDNSGIPEWVPRIQEHNFNPCCRVQPVKLNFVELHTCARTACQTKLGPEHYLIWNDIGDEPRHYCLPCGNKIIEYNRQTPPDEIKLRWELTK